MTVYRNFVDYEACLIPLLQRFSDIKYLRLVLAINLKRPMTNCFINGYDLDNGITSYMPHLHQFHFLIRSVLQNALHVKMDTIHQSFRKQKYEFVDGTLDYFDNDYGQCQIHSLPFIGARLDFVSNRFPLFDTNKTFSMVTILLLFVDIEPFENVFFEHLAQALPYLKTLEIINRLEQQEEILVSTDNLKFSQLATLILLDVHMNYAEQLLCRTYLPCLSELAIDKDILLAIIDQDQHQTRDNCSRVGRLLTSKTLSNSLNAIQNYFPLDTYEHHTNITQRFFLLKSQANKNIVIV